jgi:hypothetical protein
MNECEFEAQLKADGFQEIELQELARRPGKGGHRHLFAVRGLVLSGTFLVTQTAGPGKSSPSTMANCTMNLSALMARTCSWRKFANAKPSAG